MSATPPTASRLHGIQVLRAIAALLVVLYHAMKEVAGALHGFPTDAGRFGVDIFFVISAFVMIVTTQSGTQSPPRFLWRRFARIAPLYWITTFLAAALLLIDPALLQFTGLTLASFLKSLAFIPHDNPGNLGVATPTYLIGWTLNFEMYFYLTLTVAMAISHQRRAEIAGAIVVGCVILRNLGVSDSTVLDFIGSEIALEFVFGMVMAHLWLQNRLPLFPTPVALGALPLAIALPFGIEWLGLEINLFLVYAPAALLTVWATLSLEPVMQKKGWRGMMTLGDASYSLYLVHIFVLIAIVPLWTSFESPSASLTSALAFIIVALVASVVAAFATHAWVERPLMRVLR